MLQPFRQIRPGKKWQTRQSGAKGIIRRRFGFKPWTILYLHADLRPRWRLLLLLLLLGGRSWKENAPEKEERGQGSLPLSVIFYTCRTGIGSRFPRGKKKPWSSLLQMNIPKRKAFCKHGPKMHKCSTGADYLNGSQFPISVPKWKNKDYSCSVCEPAVSPLLTLDSSGIGVQDIAERSWLT